MKIFTSLAFLALSLPALAQQDPIYAQYMLNPLVVNPAYAGLNNRFNALAAYRTQWTGFDGQPQTLGATIHSSFAKNKVGLGLAVMNDRIGNISNTEVNASASYKLDLGGSVFSFGMQGGLQNFSADNSKLNFQRPDDGAFLSDNERGTNVNIGAGAILKSDVIFIGVSVPRLLPTTFNNGDQSFELYRQHYYVMAGYAYPINARLVLKPTALLRAVKGAPTSLDVGMNVNINALHTAGVFTRNFNTYGIILQTLFSEQYRFGYVFEMPVNKSMDMNFTTHEVTIGIALRAFSFHEHSLSNF